MANELLNGIDPVEDLSNELDIILYDFRKTKDKKKLREKLDKIRERIEGLGRNSYHSKRVNNLREKLKAIESESGK